MLLFGGSSVQPLYCTWVQYTVNRFVSTSAKFGICIFVGLNGTLEDKMLHSRVNVNFLASTSVPFRTHDGASAKLNTELT